VSRRGRVDLDKQMSQIHRMRSEMSAKAPDQRAVTTRAVARIIEDVHLAINHMLVEYFKDHLAESRPWVASATVPTRPSPGR